MATLSQAGKIARRGRGGRGMAVRGKAMSKRAGMSAPRAEVHLVGQELQPTRQSRSDCASDLEAVFQVKDRK